MLDSGSVVQSWCKSDLCPQVEHLETVWNISFRFGIEKKPKTKTKHGTKLVRIKR